AAKAAVTEHEVSEPEIALLPATVATMVRKELRYLLRNGFMATALLFPPMLVLLFSIQFGGAHPTALRRGVSPDVVFPGMMAYLVRMLMAPSYNNFAYEGRGMQTFFMLPVKFKDILMGKNLVTIIVLSAEITVCVALLWWRVGLPPLPSFLATICALVF